MQSSYRIIKNEHVKVKENKSTVIETSLGKRENFYKGSLEIQGNTIDADALIEDIKKEFDIKIQGEREQIIKKAREEADVLKIEIQENAYKESYEEGYKTGYEDGSTQGLNHGMNEALNIKKRAMDLIAQSEEYVQEYYRENKQSLLELAGTMAESIVHKTIDLSDENIMMVLEPLLREYAYKENIIITCHPDNVEFLKTKLGEIEALSGENKIVILKDGNLEKNGCSLENSQQLMDLQIKTQIENILKDIQNME